MKLGGKTIEKDAARLRVLLNSSPVPGGVVDHGSLGGLADDDHAQYVHLTAPRTIIGIHTFSPVSAVAPFILGANAQGNKVTGLNADQVDGMHVVGTGYTITFPGTGTAAMLNVANTFTLGPQTLATGADGNKALIVKTNSATQTANIMDVQLYNGAIMAYFNATGNFVHQTNAFTHITGNQIMHQVTALAQNPSGTGSTWAGVFNMFDTTAGVTTSGNRIALAAQAISYQTNAGLGGSNRLIGLDIRSYTSTGATGGFPTIMGAWISVWGNNNTAGTVNYAYALYFSSPSVASTLERAYGIYMSDVTGASIANYAILTNAGAIIFNEGGNADSDFRVEGDGDANLLFTDASADRVGIGTNSPAYKLEVVGHTRVGGTLYADSSSEPLRLRYDASNYASFSVSAGGNLTLTPTGDLVLDPNGNDILPLNNYDNNLGAINKKFLTLHAAELWVETLVAANTMATIGGRILVAPTTTLVLDLAPADTTIQVKHNNLANGDRIYLEANSSVEFMAVTSAPSGAGPYSYTVTRNLDGTGANQWYAGDAVMDTGTTGSGFIDIYSVRGVNPAVTEAGPAIVGNVRLSDTYNDWAEHWALGNLNGLYGVGVTTYGIGLGKYSATTDYMIVDATNGIRFFGTGNAMVAQLTGTTWTLGATGTENVQITTTAVQLRDATTVLTEVSGGVVTIGAAATENVLINSTAVQIRDGANVYTSLSAGVLTLGLVSGGEYVTVDGTNGIRMWGGGVQHVDLSNAGTFWVGDTATSERLTWDVTNGLRVMNASNTAVLQVPVSGDMSIVGTVAISSPGSLTAGGGNVVLDSTGLGIVSGSTDPNKVRWTSGGSTRFEISSALSGSGVWDSYLASPRISGNTWQYINLIPDLGNTDTRLRIWHNQSTEAGGMSLDLANATDAFTIASAINLYGSGNIRYTGDLISRKNATDFTGYIFVPLATPWTSTAFDGDAFSTVTTSTQINVSAFTGAPADTSHIKAYLVWVGARDSVAFGGADVFFNIGFSSTYYYTFGIHTWGGDLYATALSVIPCDANGDMWYRCQASGAGTLDVIIRIWGYYV